MINQNVENLPTDIYKYVGELVGIVSNESDRAAVILMATELDIVLTSILTKHLLPASVPNRDILSTEGSCGSFFARIELCFRLGLIDEVIAHDLHVVRKIRNEFAHGNHQVNFQLDKFRTKIDELKIIKTESGKNLLNFDDKSNPREIFQGLTFFFHGYLSKLDHRMKRCV